MPIDMICLRCGKLLTVGDEIAGGQTFCPRCAHLLSVPAPAEDSAAKTGRLRVEQADEGAPPAVLSAGWESTRRGLRFLHTGYKLMNCGVVVALIAGALVFGLSPALGPANVGQEPASRVRLVPPIIMWPFAIAVIVGMVAIVVGCLLCCRTPGESRAKAFAIGAAAFEVLALSLHALWAWPVWRAALRDSPLPILAVGVTSCAGYVLLLLFLYRVAGFFGDRALMRSILRLLVCGVVFPVVAVVVMMALGRTVAHLFSGRSRELAVTAATVLLLGFLGVSSLMLILLYWLIRVLRRARDAIARAQS